MAQNKVFTWPSFAPKHVGNLLVCLPSQADSLAQKLSDLLGGVVPLFIPATALTAHSGGTQAAALLLTAKVNVVSTVAAATDSVALPLAKVGLTVTVANGAAANSMQVFGSGTDTINGVATATGVAQAAGVTKTYYCVKAAPAGNWVG